MAYENVQFNYNNFCIAPIVDTFASIDTTNATATLQVRNSSGVVQKSFDLNPTISQGTSVRTLEYIGPRSTAAYNDAMPFFTLEHNSSSQCTIKRWKLNNTSSRLDLDISLVFNSGSTYYFDCNSMAVEYYHTTFQYATSTGTGYIRVDSVNRDRIEVGMKIYLGNSSQAEYVDTFEEVEVTAISGSYVYISSEAGYAPINKYNSDDVISFYKDLFLFSNTGISGTQTKGTFYRIDSDSGVVKDYHESAIYSGVVASTFALPYPNTVGFVKNSNLLFMDIDDFEVKKSVALLNVKSDNSIITVHDLAFTTSSFYRLQLETLRRDDTGALTSTTWSKYNYQLDSVGQYVDSITMWADPNYLYNQNTTTLYALVRNQYGSVISNQTVYFFKTSGDTAGNFIGNTDVLTNASGIASIQYTSGWYNPAVADSCCENILFSTRSDGSSTTTGSQYVWGHLYTKLRKKYIRNTWSKFVRTKIDSKSSAFNIKTLLDYTATRIIKTLSKFWSRGGHGDSPTGTGLLFKTLQNFSSSGPVKTWKELSNNTLMKIKGTKTDTMPISQTYVSRHLTSGHYDTFLIEQFRFLIDAIPAFYSEKNSIDTNIWIKVAPYGFDLDITTLSFKVKEISYAGNTGYIEYANTQYLNVLTFDAGAGLLGLDITCDPPNNFHHNGIVYVILTVYDKAVIPNKIYLDYWFKIMPDFKAPYITNESPARSEVNVAVNTNISFDILDLGVGVDLDRLELYVNNRYVEFTASGIESGYHVECDPSQDFFYGQEVDITVRAWDASPNENVLFDTYKFYCASSTGPWIDASSFYPVPCSKGVDRYIGSVSFNIYEIDSTGVKTESIKLEVDNKTRDVTIVPIIYRIM